ncbi:oxidoreductase, NAD-binding Rossmann fold family protein [Pseudarthrobacter siccitolerans]|uniref:Oxidoreductase, NAD-binding Rossmann fold family protein n=1 Tax=Pseudarthrobacter siccitolerans TaxID=861266 RepID=A0A024H716_9MICC|nr:Gfo/Idh/MocA family oxidoreductase [Pseudarthrobacter siccitolerans]CCQ47549.1 oxidoreductase, NAD-binding Rossmann fold family protein [Pseudarthrobacter siccitolerans]
MSIRAAVIGCGDVSTVHFEAVAKLDGAELVGVCDPHSERLAAAAELYGVPGFTDHQSLLDAVRPEVVHICTPHNQHASIAADCLEQGVNVIVEKPLAHTLAEGRRLVDAASKGKAKIAVCFQNRYNATSQAMHSLLATGELGAVVGAAASVMWHRSPDYYRGRPWRGSWEGGGGGLLMNQAIHTVDLLQWLVGDVVEVRGNAATRFLGGTIEVEDTAEFLAEHAGGARSVFYATLGHACNAPVTLEVVTEKAVLSLRGDLTVTYGNGRVEVIPERRSDTGGRSYWGVSHELLINDFYGLLDDAEPFWISPAEAEKSLRIIKDVYRQSYPDAVTRVS